jgi:hypothetical protein
VYESVKDEYGNDKKVEKGVVHEEDTQFLLADLVNGAKNDGLL